MAKSFFSEVKKKKFQKKDRKISKKKDMKMIFPAKCQFCVCSILYLQGQWKILILKKPTQDLHHLLNFKSALLYIKTNWLKIRNKTLEIIFNERSLRLSQVQYLSRMFLQKTPKIHFCFLKISKQGVLDIISNDCRIIAMCQSFQR